MAPLYGAIRIGWEILTTSSPQVWSFSRSPHSLLIPLMCWSTDCSCSLQPKRIGLFPCTARLTLRRLVRSVWCGVGITLLRIFVRSWSDPTQSSNGRFLFCYLSGNFVGALSPTNSPWSWWWCRLLVPCSSKIYSWELSPRSRYMLARLCV